MSSRTPEQKPHIFDNRYVHLASLAISGYIGAEAAHGHAEGVLVGVLAGAVVLDIVGSIHLNLEQSEDQQD